MQIKILWKASKQNDELQTDPFQANLIDFWKNKFWKKKTEDDFARPNYPYFGLHFVRNDEEPHFAGIRRPSIENNSHQRHPRAHREDERRFDEVSQAIWK